MVIAVTYLILDTANHNYVLAKAKLFPWTRVDSKKLPIMHCFLVPYVLGSLHSKKATLLFEYELRIKCQLEKKITDIFFYVM